MAGLIGFVAGATEPAEDAACALQAGPGGCRELQSAGGGKPGRPLHSQPLVIQRPAYDETQLRREFVDPLRTVLGWETEQTAIERQIDATDREIAQLVYESYGLIDGQIRIVEDTARGCATPSASSPPFPRERLCLGPGICGAGRDSPAINRGSQVGIARPAPLAGRAPGQGSIELITPGDQRA